MKGSEKGVCLCRGRASRQTARKTEGANTKAMTMGQVCENTRLLLADGAKPAARSTDVCEHEGDDDGTGL